jgi:hypothetical protein
MIVCSFVGGLSVSVNVNMHIYFGFLGVLFSLVWECYKQPRYIIIHYLRPYHVAAICKLKSYIFEK